MIAMTVRPPWSWAIAETAALTALGVTPKGAENRGQRIADQHIGQRIAIHAGKTWCTVGEADRRIRDTWFTFSTAINPWQPHPLLAAIGDTRTGYVGWLQPGLWLETGAVVAVATLTGCHQAEQQADSPTGVCCAPWGEAVYQTKRGEVPAWHLTFAEVRRLPVPVSCRGQVRVPWELPEDAAEAVRRQLDMAVTR